jgi:hypothetical protein
MAKLFGRFVRDLRGLGGNERIAVIGCAVMIGSLLLPWYQSPISNDLVLTGIGGFSWAEGALLLIAAATTFLALQGGGGYIPPRPLREWGLFVAAGVWAAAIVVYRMFDRPPVRAAPAGSTRAPAFPPLPRGRASCSGRGRRGHPSP